MKSNDMMINSNNYLRDVIINFMVAGRDTTASALTWAIYELGRNPDILKRLQQEVNSKDCTMKSFQEMIYLNGFIHEILRLYPPIPVDCKVCLHNTILSNGVKIKKNDRVFYYLF